MISAIPGETNIFGQFRRAWKQYQADAQASSVEYFSPLIERLFADCRNIRQTFLEGIGGASYGSLVRKLCRAETDSRILFVGAGDLAQSIVPFFDNRAIALWNHRPITATGSHRVFAPAAADLAAEWTDRVILTTPADQANDRLWSELLTTTGARTIVHLGRRKADRGPWIRHSDFFDLDDIFALREQQSNVRSLNLRRARKACADKAAQFSIAARQGQNRSQALA